MLVFAEQCHQLQLVVVSFQPTWSPRTLCCLRSNTTNFSWWLFNFDLRAAHGCWCLRSNTTNFSWWLFNFDLRAAHGCSGVCGAIPPTSVGGCLISTYEPLPPSLLIFKRES